MQKNLFFTALTFVLISCNPIGSDSSQKNTAKQTTSNDDKISEVRNNPAKEPVAKYVKKVNNDLNEWYFRVQLYETKQRFVYRMVMEYETINEEKEITFPNLNEDPKPEIRPGSRTYDAIVGFEDNKGAFKEYVNVFVEDDNLRLRTLKHYAVTQKEVQ